MEQKNNSENSKTIGSSDTNISYNSSLDNSMTNENSKKIKEVCFNPKISVVEIKNYKKLNLKNNISQKEIYNNLMNEKRRIKEEIIEREAEERKNESCAQCFIF